MPGDSSETRSKSVPNEFSRARTSSVCGHWLFGGDDEPITPPPRDKKQAIAGRVAGFAPEPHYTKKPCARAPRRLKPEANNQRLRKRQRIPEGRECEQEGFGQPFFSRGKTPQSKSPSTVTPAKTAVYLEHKTPRGRHQQTQSLSNTRDSTRAHPKAAINPRRKADRTHPRVEMLQTQTRPEKTGV